MKPTLPIQIPLCGRRPPALGALTEAMRSHQRPFVLLMDEPNRHELVAAISKMSDQLSLLPCLLDANDVTALKQHLFEKETPLITIIESERSRLPVDVQTLILERYEPPVGDDREIRKRIKAGATAEEIRESFPKTFAPSGLLVVTDTDPGELCSKGLWTPAFTALKHFTVRWDAMPQRPDAYHGVFRAGLTAAAREMKLDITTRVDDEAVERYARMQKILASHARKGKERGLKIEAHPSVSEVMLAARDCVRYIGDKADRRIDTNVIEALVFKRVTEASLKATFGLAEPKPRKSRPSFGPEAPYAKASGE